jgi:hypothetical protein
MFAQQIGLNLLRILIVPCSHVNIYEKLRVYFKFHVTEIRYMSEWIPFKFRVFFSPLWF